MSWPHGLAHVLAALLLARAERLSLLLGPAAALGWCGRRLALRARRQARTRALPGPLGLSRGSAEERRAALDEPLSRERLGLGGGRDAA